MNRQVRLVPSEPGGRKCRSEKAVLSDREKEAIMILELLQLVKCSADQVEEIREAFKVLRRRETCFSPKSKRVGDNSK